MTLTRPGRIATAAIVLLTACCAVVHAQYPSRPVQIVVPFGPGTTDALARVTANCLSGRFRQSVVILNRPGANGMIGANAVKTAPPDGYTLLFGASTLVTDLALSTNPAFDVRRDLEPITKVLFGVQGVYVPAALPVHSVTEFIAHVRANPGKVNYGSLGVGSVNQLAIEALAITTGSQIVHIPFPKGSGPMLASLMTGEIQLVMTDVNTAQGAVESGRVRLLAILASQRLPSRPSVPTLSESIPAMAPYVGTLWFGYFAPLHTPRDIIERNYADLKACHGEDDVRAQFRKLGHEGNQFVSSRPEEFRASMLDDVARLSDLVKKANIKPQ